MKKILLFFSALFAAVTVFAQSPTVSASSVTFKYCQTTEGTASEYATAFPYSWHGKQFSQAGEYVETITNTRGCDSIITLTIKDAVGEIPFAFSVASDRRVFFSQGNLQYCAHPSTSPTTHNTRDGQNTQGIWRFAEHQWDFVGYQYGSTNYIGTVSGSNNRNRDNANYSGWVDIFYYGRSGYDNWNYITKNNSGIRNNNYDWGYYNAISNGGNVYGRWFVLSTSEWLYLLNTRTNAKQLRSYGCVTNGNKVITGLILLPDNWTTPPEGLSFMSCQSNYTTNTYSAADWNRMQEQGAVFVPTCSVWDGNNWQSNYNGCYWCSDSYNYVLGLCSNPVSNATGDWSFSYGSNNRYACLFSVRLVRLAH